MFQTILNYNFAVDQSKLTMIKTVSPLLKEHVVYPKSLGK